FLAFLVSKCNLHFIAVGNIQRADNCSQLNLSGSSSSLASEASNKNSGQRSYGIGGAYLQKKIQEMIVKARDSADVCEKGGSKEASEKAELELEHRRRKGTLFGRLRERSFSRERTAFAAKREAEHPRASERSEKQEDIDSDALSTASIYGNSSLLAFHYLQRRIRRRRKTI
uniref:Uncharacterized protein n=1 Tax=Nothoprocta perdicaria TaxID=30464 RepID=A0A8C6YQB5_NOTPE